MASFGFLKKEKAPENKPVQNNNGDPSVWLSTDAIFIDSQYIFGPGMHTSCIIVKYSNANRVAVCCTRSTSDNTPRYENLAVPAEINTADGLIAFIMSKTSWLVHGYNLSDELRRRLDATFNGNDQKTGNHPVQMKDVSINDIHSGKNCSNDKHNFIKAGIYDGKALYRCDKCGLEVHAPPFSEMIFKEYFGSYIDGISHRWIPSDMRAEDIVDFEVSFGDLPIVSVKYDGATMKVKNKINVSRDGWKSFPKGYFDERIINVTNNNKRKLYECLKSLDFSLFATCPDLFQNFGAFGFCISNRFLCHFSNGKGFESLSPCSDNFYTLVEVVKNIIGMKSKRVRSKVLCDDQKPGWHCAMCGSANKIDYKFCRKCGTKSPLQIHWGY